MAGKALWILQRNSESNCLCEDIYKTAQWHVIFQLNLSWEIQRATPRMPPSGNPAATLDWFPQNRCGAMYLADGDTNIDLVSGSDIHMSDAKHELGRVTRLGNRTNEDETTQTG